MKKSHIGNSHKFIFFSGVVPLVVWMLLIFYFSSQPRIPITTNYVVSFAIFKTLHLVEYAILFFLWVRFLLLMRVHKAFIFAFIATVLYAGSDELHQMFIPTREGMFRDVLVDTIGAGLMYMGLKMTQLKNLLPAS